MVSLPVNPGMPRCVYPVPQYTVPLTTVAPAIVEAPDAKLQRVFPVAASSAIIVTGSSKIDPEHYIPILSMQPGAKETAMPELNPYAKFLDGRPIPEILASTPATLESLTEAIGLARLAVPPSPGKWTPSEILSHLADCEIAFGFRLRQTLAEDNHTVQPFDQEKWAATYPAITAQQALAAFTAMREWNLILIRNAPQGSAQVTSR